MKSLVLILCLPTDYNDHSKTAVVQMEAVKKKKLKFFSSGKHPVKLALKLALQFTIHFKFIVQISRLMDQDITVQV